ncbi:unnamed protein product, partial [marine sediment metagenome]
MVAEAAVEGVDLAVAPRTRVPIAHNARNRQETDLAGCKVI